MTDNRAADYRTIVRAVLIVMITVTVVFALASRRVSYGESAAAELNSSVTLDDDFREFTLKGEKVFIAGDSIQNKAQYRRYGAFIHRACKKLGARRIYNVARSGATLADAHNGFATSTYRQVRSNLKTIRKCRYVFISAGTNDYGGGYLGWAKASKATRSLRKMIRLIHKVSPKAKIIVVTPIHRYKYHSGKLTDCEKWKNRLDHKSLAEYRKAIEKTAGAKRYRDYVMVVKGTTLLPKKKMKSLRWTWDHLHPKARTAKKYLAPALVDSLTANSDWLMAKPAPEMPPEAADLEEKQQSQEETEQEPLLTPGQLAVIEAEEQIEIKEKRS